MQVTLRHSSGLRTRLELLPHPLRNATPDSTVETWTTAVGGCDNGLLNNEDYRPNLEWKYAAAMPQTAGTTSSQGRGSLRKTIRRIRRGAPSSHQEAKRNFFNSCLHTTSIKCPACLRSARRTPQFTSACIDCNLEPWQRSGRPRSFRRCSAAALSTT